MYFVVILILVILLVIFIKSLNNKANELLDVFSVQTSEKKEELQKKQSIEGESFFEQWRKKFPNEYDALQQLTGRNLTKISDVDARQLIISFARMADVNNLYDWRDIKTFILAKFSEMYDDIGEKESIDVINETIKLEVEKTNYKIENTASYYTRIWFLDFVKQEKRKPFIRKTIIFPNNYDDKNELLDSIKNQYKEALDDFVKQLVKKRLCCIGYDSEVAQEIMKHMYYYVRDLRFQEFAKKGGIWNEITNYILEQTGIITEEYCKADIQECMDYFNYPYSPVRTSHRCPYCGSKHISIEDYGDIECRECGCEWHAPLGYNMYI